MKNIKMNCKNLIKNLYLNTFEAIHCELLRSKVNLDSEVNLEILSHLI